MTETVPTTKNSEARQAIIRQVCKELAGLESERDAVSAQIKELKSTKIKGDLGMKIADFNAAYRLYSLEGDDRNIFFDTLRETFHALGVGEQLDWLDVPAPQQENGEAKGNALEKAGFDGLEAGRAGMNADRNPHPHGTDLSEAWRIGHAEGQRQIHAAAAEQWGRPA